MGGLWCGGAEIYVSTALAVSFSATTAEDRDGINFPVVHIPAALQTARYWTCKIVDTANAAGYVQIARVAICGKFQPTVTMSVGAKQGLMTDTDRKSTDGGADIFQAKAVRRTQDFTLEQIEESEALTKVWKMQRQLGKHGQLMWVFDTADTTYLHERAFLATLEELGGLDYPHVISRMGSAYRLREVL